MTGGVGSSSPSPEVPARLHILLLPSWYPRHSNDVRGVFMRDQALALAARGHRVGVIAPGMRSIVEAFSGERIVKGVQQENDEGVVTYRREFWGALPRVPYGNYLLWRRVAERLLKRYVEQEGWPDVIHAHSALFAGAVAAEWKTKYGMPFLLTEHSSTFAQETLGDWQLRLVAGAAYVADARIAVSPALGELLSQRLAGVNMTSRWMPKVVAERFAGDGVARQASGAGAMDWQWIPNVVAQRFLENGTGRLRSGGTVRLLNLALMTEIKGQHDLIRAFAMGFEGRSDVELWFGGDGPLEQELQQEAQTLGVSDCVRFLGRVVPAHVPELLRKVDAVVISSHYETFGVVAAEALMCGIPVVATRCGGPECIVQEGDGLLVAPRAPDALAVGLRQLVAGLADIDRAAIAERARRRFSPEVIGSRLEELYVRVLAESPRHCATA